MRGRGNGTILGWAAREAGAAISRPAQKPDLENFSFLLRMCQQKTVYRAFLALSTLPLLANSVSGTLQIDGKPYPLNQAIAIRTSSTFLSGAPITRVAFTDAAITQAELLSPTSLLARMKQSPIHGLTMEFSDDRGYFSLSLIDSSQNTTASLSGTMENFKFTKHTPQQVAGRYTMAERSLGKLRLAIDLQFDVTPLAPPAAAPKGALKKGSEAQSLASVKAYLAMRKAVQTLDLAAIQKLARYPQDFQGPDGLKFLKLMKEDEPTGIIVVEASEGPDTATLTVTGTKAGKPIRKTFDMQLKDGRWTTNNDNWEAN